MNQLQSFLENICIILYISEKEKRMKMLLKANLKKLIKTDQEMKLRGKKL